MYQNEIFASINTVDSEFLSKKNLISYLQKRITKSQLNVEVAGISNLENWKFDSSGMFRHVTGRYFSIQGIKYKNSYSGILNQPEVGVLSNFMTIHNGIAYFLIQFKEEPGNINKIQLSPTIQATKSNYSRVHGGSLPQYWNEYTIYCKKNTLLSYNLPEQGTRYWRKYNKNEIILTPLLSESENFKWLTLGQLFALQNFPNSINSCLRSSLSLIFELTEYSKSSQDKLGNKLNNFSKLKSKNSSKLGKNIENFYNPDSDSINISSDFDTFEVIGVNVSSQSREIITWSQPLVKEKESQQYFLIYTKIENKIYILWSLDTEPGLVNTSNLGPTLKNISYRNEFNKNLSILPAFNNIKKFNMSEEGGRFYKFEIEHNICEIDFDESLLSNENFIILDINSSVDMNNKGLMSMEARSLFFFFIKNCF